MPASKVLINTSSFAKHDKHPLQLLRLAGLETVINPYKRKLSESELLQLIYDHDPIGIIAGVESLSERVLSQAPSLKAIARVGIGLDSVDIAAAKALGISVSNTPDAPTSAVAELTLGMILTLLRGIHVSDASIRAQEWKRPMGNLLQGKTAGLIGCGRIGSALARYLQAFDCRVLGSDPGCTDHGHLEISNLNKLLAESDIVSLHCPYSDSTYHFMDKARIQNMKPGSILINTARGGLVDELALYEALNEGHLAGAAMDCFEEEPYKGPLSELNNTLLTAHIGSYSKETRIRMEKQAAENLIQQLENTEIL